MFEVTFSQQDRDRTKCFRVYLTNEEPEGTDDLLVMVAGTCVKDVRIVWEGCVLEEGSSFQNTKTCFDFAACICLASFLSRHFNRVNSQEELEAAVGNFFVEETSSDVDLEDLVRTLQQDEIDDSEDLVNWMAVCGADVLSELLKRRRGHCGKPG